MVDAIIDQAEDLSTPLTSHVRASVATGFSPDGSREAVLAKLIERLTTLENLLASNTNGVYFMRDRVSSISLVVYVCLETTDP